MLVCWLKLEKVPSTPLTSSFLGFQLHTTMFNKSRIRIKRTNYYWLHTIEQIVIRSNIRVGPNTKISSTQKSPINVTGITNLTQSTILIYASITFYCRTIICGRNHRRSRRSRMVVWVGAYCLRIAWVITTSQVLIVDTSLSGICSLN